MVLFSFGSLTSTENIIKVYNNVTSTSKIYLTMLVNQPNRRTKILR